MTDQNDNFSHPAKVFKYKELKWVVAWAIVMFFFMLYLEIGAVRDEGFSTAAIFILGMFTFLETLAVVGMCSSSDVIIDDKGISRSFFGKKWGGVEWDKIKRIRISRVPAPEYNNKNKMDRVFIFYKTDQGRWPYAHFIEHFKNADELVALLNDCVEKHNIKVEEIAGKAVNMVGHV